MNNINSRTSNAQFSVVIPCIPRDTHKLDRCLQSISRQTYQPCEVIISHSGISDKKNEELLLKFNSNNYKFIIKISSKEGKANAAENRNRGVKVSSNCDYISFIDSDDAMQPQRLEILNKIIEKENPLCIGHAFSNSENILNKVFTENEIESALHKIDDGLKFNEIHNDTRNQRYWLYVGMHHGNVTERKDVFNHITQNESSRFRRCEDSKFLRDLLDFFPIMKNTIMFVPLQLSCYLINAAQNG